MTLPSDPDIALTSAADRAPADAPEAGDSPARRAHVEERLAFNPVHALQEHRPPGSVNRARMAVYVRTQDYRQTQNRAPPAEPATLADVPN